MAVFLLPSPFLRWRHMLLVLLLGIGGLMASGGAHAQDHITQRSWLEDPTGRLEWPEISQRPTQPFEGVLSRGFGEGVIWLRLRVDPQTRPPSVHEPDLLIMRIRPVYLDDIQVFDPLSATGKIGVTGDHHHPRAQAFDGPDFMLPIARGIAPRDIWLRLQSTSTRQIAVQVVNYDDLQKLPQTQHLIFALYIGVILIFMVWGLVSWLFSRELVIGAFAFKQLAALGFAASSLGYTRVYWPAHWPAYWIDTSTSIFAVLAVSMAIYFHVVLLREFAPPRWVSWMFKGLLALLPLKLLLLAAGQTHLALRINMMEVLLAPMVFLAASLLARGWKTAQAQSQIQTRPLLAKWVVVGFYTLLLVILLLASLPGLGLTKGGEVPLYLVQAHGLVTAFLILLMLQYRARVQQKLQGETAIALERSLLQAQQERSIREEQEKLLTMLAHELKTPLATMQMRLDANAPGSREVRRAIKDMNAVIERCIQTTQLGDRQLQAQMAPLDLCNVVRDAVSSCAQPERVEIHLPAAMNVMADRQLLFIVLSNLLENACKYAEAGSPIQLRLYSEDAQARIEVSNPPGPSGWPEADKVFDKYYRTAHARRQAGTGLGLYLVRNLMEVLGGRIDYRPDSLNVRFVLTLPLPARPD